VQGFTEAAIFTAAVKQGETVKLDKRPNAMHGWPSTLRWRHPSGSLDELEGLGPQREVVIVVGGEADPVSKHIYEAIERYRTNR
jgi:hypothetical protein